MPDLTGLGVGGIFALLVLKEVFSFVSKKNGNGKQQEYAGLIKRIHDLWYWHAPDQDGEQSWKGKNIERVMIALDKNMQENTRILSEGNAKIVSKLDELISRT